MNVRDKRTQKRFFVDNDIIRKYGQGLGPIGIATYCALCLHADVEDQNCWPSHQTIAAEIGASVASVKRALQHLKNLNLIDWDQRYAGGRQRSNEYWLLDVPGSSEGATTVAQGELHGSSEGATMNNPQHEQSSEEQSPTDAPSAQVIEPTDPEREEIQLGEGTVARKIWEQEQFIIHAARMQRTITCPGCETEREWPRTEAGRRKALDCINRKCGATFVVHSYKASSGKEYTYWPNAALGRPLKAQWELMINCRGNVQRLQSLNDGELNGVRACLDEDREMFMDAVEWFFKQDWARTETNKIGRIFACYNTMRERPKGKDTPAPPEPEREETPEEEMARLMAADKQPY